MSLASLVATHENNDENIIKVDENDILLQEAFLELDIEDAYDDEVYNDSYENMLNIVRERADDIEKGKYTLEEAIKFEEGLDIFISADTAKEDVKDVAYNKTEIMHLNRMLNVVNEMLIEEGVEIEDDDFTTASLEEELNASLEEESPKDEDTKTADPALENDGEGTKSTDADPALENDKDTKTTDGDPALEAEAATEKSGLFTRISNKIKEVYSKIKANPSNPLNFWKRHWDKVKGTRGDLSKGGRALSGAKLATLVLGFLAGIMLLFRKIRRYKVNYDKQTTKLNSLSGEFNGDKKVNILSKSDLDGMVKACKSILGSVKKAANDESISTAEDALAKFNESDLSTLGISVSKRGKAKFGKAKKEKKTLSEHGYSAGDASKYKAAHKAIGDMMFNTGQALANGTPGIGRGSRAIAQVADKAYRFTMTHLFATTISLGS